MDGVVSHKPCARVEHGHYGRACRIPQRLCAALTPQEQRYGAIFRLPLIKLAVARQVDCIIYSTCTRYCTWVEMHSGPVA